MLKKGVGRAGARGRLGTPTCVSRVGRRQLERDEKKKRGGRAPTRTLGARNSLSKIHAETKGHDWKAKGVDGKEKGGKENLISFWAK